MIEVKPEKCTKITPHPSHYWTVPDNSEWWCSGVKSTGMPERICYNREEHGPHRWSPDSGLSYLQCPGGEAREDVPRHCGSTQHHPEHPWAENNIRYWCGGEKGYPPPNFDRVVMKWPCENRTVHEPHDYQRSSDGLWQYCPGLFGTSIGEIAVSEDSAQVIQVASPPAWKYHVEVLKETGWSNSAANMGEEVTTYHVVRKGGAHPQHIAEYTNAVYARIVADALNGGVLLGFEVEK